MLSKLLLLAAWCALASAEGGCPAHYDHSISSTALATATSTTSPAGYPLESVSNTALANASSTSSSAAYALNPPPTGTAHPTYPSNSTTSTSSSSPTAQPPSSSTNPSYPTAAPPSTSIVPSSISPASSTVSSSSPASSPTSPATGGNGTVYKVSITQYGSTDTWGSGSCNVKTAACGWYTTPGFSAAISEAAYGVGPGAGAGPGCGLCWRVSPETDSTGNKIAGLSSIVVMVNNLCPKAGNPLCAQNTLNDTNQYGAAINFDLCIDSGASKALFGAATNIGLSIGTAQQVDCKEWSGTVVR